MLLHILNVEEIDEFVHNSRDYVHNKSLFFGQLDDIYL